MKILLLISFLLFISCHTKFNRFEKKDYNKLLMNYSSDVFITHTSFSYFATEGTMSSIQLIGKMKESFDLNLGNFYFDDSLVQINGKRSYQFSESYDRNFDRYIGKIVKVKYDGNDTFGFKPFESKISIINELKSKMSPVNAQVDLTKNFKIEWIPLNTKEYIALYVIWHGDRNIQIPRLWSKFIKDDGSYSIPMSVFKDYSSEGKVDIKLVRFSSVIEKSGNKKVFILSKSTLSGLFRITKPK